MTSGETDAVEPAQPDMTALVRPAWTTKLDVIGQPEIAGPVAVVIARTGRQQTELVALNLDDGHERWRRPISPGSLSSYYAFEPDVVRTASGQDRVIVRGVNRTLLGGYSYTPLAVVDPRSGRVVHESGSMSSNEPVAECADGRDLCGVGWAGRAYQPFRWNVSTGNIAPLPGVADARSLGGGMFSTADRPGEEIFVLRDGKPAWRTPVADLFGARATSDRAWQFDRFDADGVLAGSIGRAFPSKVLER